MDLSKALETLWPYLTAGAVALIWFVRLEGKVSAQEAVLVAKIASLEADLQAHKDASKEKNDKLWEALKEFGASLTTTRELVLQGLAELKAKLEKE